MGLILRGRSSGVKIKGDSCKGQEPRVQGSGVKSGQGFSKSGSAERNPNYMPMFNGLAAKGLGVAWLPFSSQDWKDVPEAAKKMLPEGSTLIFCRRTCKPEKTIN